MDANVSEVARLRKQLADECLAFRNGLDGLAVVARHEIIQRRYSTAGAIADQLAKHVGKPEAYQELGSYF